MDRGVDRQRGFTLIEVLVALVVLGFLVTALTYGIRSGLALWAAGQRRVGMTAELDGAARALRAVLTRIPTRPMANGAGADLGLARLRGSADRFAFVGELPTGLGDTRLADITLTASQDRLVLLWSPHRHEQASAAKPEPAESDLVRGIERLGLDYWGSPRPNDPPRWQASWDALYPPELIRVRLSFPEGDLRRWPDLIVAPPP